MSENSPTDQGTTQDGSQSDLPAQSNTNQSADGRQESVSSSTTQQTDQQNNNDQQNQGSTTGQQSSSSDDDGLSKFAKSQGIDSLDDLSERERKLLKTAHDNQKAFRTTKQKNSDELRRTTQEVNTIPAEDLNKIEDESERREVQRDSEIAQLRAAQTASDFWSQNEEAREYEADMVALIQREKETRGIAAARYLAGDLKRVFLLAKAERGSDSDAIAEQARREERERLRKQQEGGADNGQAQQQSTSGKKITRADIDAMSEADYAEFKKSGGLQKAISSGELY